VAALRALREGAVVSERHEHVAGQAFAHRGPHVACTVCAWCPACTSMVDALREAGEAGEGRGVSAGRLEDWARALDVRELPYADAPEIAAALRRLARLERVLREVPCTYENDCHLADALEEGESG
jgi:hypothetical protein